MRTASTTPPSIDDLATRTVRLGRELCETAQSVYVGGNSRDVGFVERALRRFGERQPFDDRDEASLEALRGILGADIRSETVGTEPRFIETGYGPDGPLGEIRYVPVYTERGEELVMVEELLSDFIAARNATLDRIAAEHAVLRLLQP